MPSAETARLIASLELRDQFTPGVNKALGGLGRLDAGLNRSASRSYKAGQQIGNGIKNSARIIAAAGVTLGTVAAGVFAKGLAAASDLSETVSKVGVVFGKMSGPILAFGKDSAAALGLSQNAALGAAATYGNLFVSMGLAQKKSADMSISLVKLAGDLASFNNIDPAEALEKLRAGLTGESEPLKTLGINLNEQTLKAKALELGLVKLTKGQKTYTAVLDPATKAQAAYALIMEQSKTAQGDFARTSGGLANQVRILRANFTDMLATLAGPSLPAVAKIFQRLNAEIKSGQGDIAKLGERIGSLFTDQNIEKGTALIKGGIQAARDAAPIVLESAKTTLGFVQAAVSLFRSLPPEIQKLAIGAVAINKVTGGLVTNIAGGIIETVGKQFLQRGGTPANPLFVADVTKGLGGLGGAAGAAGLGSKLLGAAQKVFVVGLAAEAASLIAGPLQDVGKDIHTSLFGPNGDPLSDFGKAWEDWRRNADWPFGQKNAPEWAGGTPAAAGPSPITAGGFDSRQVLSAITAGGFDSRVGTSIADKLGVLMKGAIAAVKAVDTSQFKQMIAALKDSKGTKAVSKAVADAVALVIGKGRGNVENTKDVLATLRRQLSNTHDPKLQAALRSAIAKVEHKVTGRAEVQKQLAKADQIVRSNRTTAEKIRDLKAVQQALGTRSVNATRLVQQKIDQAKRAEVEATRAVSRTVNAKRWHFTNNISVATRVSVNPLESSKVQTTAKRAYSTLL